ncbi:rod-binding protein [Campylobacter canadensis]|uniref:Rod-binding protein n=2 Tax=Campylobacter canadensis TaxID=449520 RepID=A0ABS7WQ76_9BACT|nr:rod-binding protein [Campylobacter canadensis]MBZ7986926.1 rod-binding protein [Campylobacter canadensis]MBZ7997962.1 rod-binding protein [Campylobacter canadensis]
MKINNFNNTYNSTHNINRNLANMSVKNEFDNFLNKEIQAKSNEDKLLKEQTDEYEALMIKSVLDLSLKTSNSLFGKDAGDDIYNSMYNDAISKSLSGGLGISNMLYNFLKERV